MNQDEAHIKSIAAFNATVNGSEQKALDILGLERKATPTQVVEEEKEEMD